MRILAVDPGSEKSGWCLLWNGVPVEWGWEKNSDLKDRLSPHDEFGVYEVCLHCSDHLVIEDVSHYGKDISVGNDVFQTVRWTGRFDQAWGGEFTYIKRPTVKTYLCGMPTAKDKDVRQAVIDHYGGDAKALGGKKCATCHGSGLRGRGKARGRCPECHCADRMMVAGKEVAGKGCGYQSHPGMLHGVSGHAWSALAVGLTWLAQQEAE
jgi:hypothetical protein